MIIENVKRIDDKISFLPCSEEPLSAEVYLIRGKAYTYVVDVGSSDRAYEIINAIDKKKIIITHFHDDHMKNLKRLDISEDMLFLGDHTEKILESRVYSDEFVKCGTVVKKSLEMTDGIKLQICPIPSSHAKGSLGVIVCNEYLLIGDGYYCSSKGYNVSLLHDEISVLKSLDFTKVIMSHDEKVYSKEEILSELEAIYAKKDKSSPFIIV